MKIVETSNYCLDYPDEKFLLFMSFDEETAQKIADLINGASGKSDRFWKVVEDNYIPKLGLP